MIFYSIIMFWLLWHHGHTTILTICLCWELVCLIHAAITAGDSK